MKTQYQLNPKDYKVEEAKITRASIEQAYSVKYLALQLESTAKRTLEYPAINLSDLNAGLKSLLQTMEVDTLPEVIHRSVYIVRDSQQREDVFLLFNPINNQFFSLQAQFFPESYDEALQTMLNDRPDLNINHLNKTERLLVTVVNSLSEKNEYLEQMQKVVNTHILYNNLLEKTEFKSNISSETVVKNKI